MYAAFDNHQYVLPVKRDLNSLIQYFLFKYVQLISAKEFFLV
jgi:hypothetical protein